MASPSDNLICYIRRLAADASQMASSDSALLGRYVANRDERAFAALVERHAALVLQVCWRILENAHDAQDAFQATFLVLARKAATVCPPEALPAWLHGVARRVALKTRSARHRHQRMERSLAATTMDSRPDPLAELATRDFLAIIDEEVQRLTEVHRLPVILCCLEGRSIEEAAQQLGWTTGSVKGRLERGRARLHERLVRRGLTLPAVLAAVEVSRCAASATVVARQAALLVPAAMSFATRQTSMAAAASAQAAALAQGVIKSMALAKLKPIATLLLAACLLVGGLLTQRQVDVPQRTALEIPVSSSPSPDLPRLDTAAALSENAKSSAGEAISDRIEIRGCVLDPQGQPFAGANLYVGYTPRRSEPDAVSHLPLCPLRTRSGKDGRFHFSFARSDLDGRYLDASRPVVMATADGFGLDWAEIGGGSTATVSLRLVEDFPLEGRVLDAQRQLVAGAKVFVRALSNDSAPNLDRFSATSKMCWGPLPGQPPQVTTAGNGRFRLSGLGRDRHVTLAVEGPGISPSSFWMKTCSAEFRQDLDVPLELVASAPRSIRGIVRDKKTGQAVGGVKIRVQRSQSSTCTDKDGRYELLVPLGLPEYVVLAEPQNGQLYFAATARAPNTSNQAPLTADFELMGGIPLHGRVTDQATGEPPKRAVVEYYPLFPNARSSVLTRLEHLQAASSAMLQADGSYSLTVFPGPGAVLVAASPRDSYACARIDGKELANLFKGEDSERRREALRRLRDQEVYHLSLDGADHGGSSWLLIGSYWGMRCVDRYNALALIHPDEKARSLTLDLRVRPARPVRGTVLGPDGEPLRGVAVCGLTSMPDAEILEGPSFTVEGLNPLRTRELSFHHKEKGLGKLLILRGDQTKELRVQLEPCGVIIGRIVDKSSEPVPRVDVGLSSGGNGLYVHVETDRQGRFRAALVPGLSYRLGTSRRTRPVNPLVLRSGQIKDIGDLLLDN